MLSVKRAIQYPASFVTGLEKFLIENLLIDSRTVIPWCIAKGQVYLLKCVACN